MMIPKCPRPSSSEDCGVSVDLESVNASPALESRGFTRDSGFGGPGKSGGFPRAQGIGRGSAFRTVERLLRQSRPEGMPQGGP